MLRGPVLLLMRVLEPQTRFLLRGSALLAGLLTLWWFVLLGPMLNLLKGAARAFVFIEETSKGDWSIRVPFEKILPATRDHPVAQEIRSIDFDLPRDDAIAFTFSLPVYWAIILAAPGGRRRLRSLLLGTGLVSAIELALFLVFAQITAGNAVSQFGGIEDADGKWIRHVGEYMVVNVLPYALPFVVALSIHRELRVKVLASGEDSKPAGCSTLVGRGERRPARVRRPG
jgi:hypothetical protein